MSTDCFSWLHLTDFHYGLKGQGCLWPSLREPFLDSLADLHERCGRWHAVLFTGDLVQSGESAQFEKMQAEVLDPLWQTLDELGSGTDPTEGADDRSLFALQSLVPAVGRGLGGLHGDLFILIGVIHVRIGLIRVGLGNGDRNRDRPFQPVNHCGDGC